MMSQPDGTLKRYTEVQVFDEERKLLLRRREAAGFPKPVPPTTKVEAPSEIPKEPTVVEQVGDTVGFALSGGGVRSAAFSLGLIQALHRFGVLRFVDYVSAASGGTYTVGMLSKAVKPEHTYAASEFRLASGKTGTDSEFVKGVRQRGNYLLRLDKLIAPYLPNFLLNLVPRVAILLALGALIAFLWRILDFQGIRDYYIALGYDSDLLTALTPAIAAAVLWMLLFVLGLFLQSPRLQWWARLFTWVTLAMFLISFAVLIGNGDISLSEPNHEETENRVFWFKKLWTPLLTLVGIGCVPLLLAPRQLIRSGTDPRTWRDSWTFYYVSLTLFIGVPLLSVAWFARENISSFNDNRGPELVQGEIKDQPAFYNIIAGDFDDEIIEFPNHGIEARLHIPRDRQDLDLHLGRAFVLLRKIQDDGIALLQERRFPVRRISNGEPLPHDPMVRMSYATWHLWGFFGVTLDSFAQYLWDDVDSNTVKTDAKVKEFDEHPAFTRFLWRTHINRTDEKTAREWLNRKMSDTLLLQFDRLHGAERGPASKYLHPRRKIEKTSDRLKLFLGMTAANIDYWTNKNSLPPDRVVPERRDFAEFNRLLLEAVYPQIIRDRSELRRTILINYDQAHRAVWCILALSTAIIVSWFINPNTTNSHGFYRDSLAATYLIPESCPGSDEAPPSTPLKDVNMSAQGLPYPLFNAATVDRSSWRIADQLEAPFVPFLLSPEFVGNSELKFIRTRELGDATPSIADAMAISGAALNPAYFVQHFVAFLMGLLNLRLGQSLPNPRVFDGKPPRPSMLREFLESIFDQPRERSHVLLTDGGHVDNLAVEQLLQRRCRVIIVCDSGHDPDHGMDDFAKVLRRLESEHGIRISDIAPSTKNDTTPGDGHPVRIPRQLAVPILGKDPGEALEKLDKLFTNPSNDRHFFVARILYPECGAETKEGSSQHPEKEGRLIYVKPCLTGDEGVRLYNYAKRHREFPHEPTHDQAFDEAQFDSYRRLGFHSGLDLCSKLTDPILVGCSAGTLWSSTERCDAKSMFDQMMPNHAFNAINDRNIVLEEVQELCAQFAAAVHAKDKTKQDDIAYKLAAYGTVLGVAAGVLAEIAWEFQMLDSTLLQFTNLPAEGGWDERAIVPLMECIRRDPDIEKMRNGKRIRLASSQRLAIRWLRHVKPDEGFSPFFISIIEDFAIRQTDPKVGRKAVRLLSVADEMSHATKTASIAALASIETNGVNNSVRMLAGKLRIRAMLHRTANRSHP